ncbi:MAG TPA: hypothetical protein VHP58_01290 [Alphaproteobacteria bacterium]|nr:hypothetical protein [Alphaproteobacteria bacterium]
MASFVEEHNKLYDPYHQIRKCKNIILDADRLYRQVKLDPFKHLLDHLPELEKATKMAEFHLGKAQNAFDMLEPEQQQAITYNFSNEVALVEPLVQQLRTLLNGASLMAFALESVGTLTLDKELVDQMRSSIGRASLQVIRTPEAQAPRLPAPAMLDLKANPPESFEQEPLVIAESAPEDDADTFYVDRLENPWVSEPAGIVPVAEPVAESPAIAQVLGHMEALFEPLPERQQVIDIDVPASSPVADITHVGVAYINDDPPREGRFGQGPQRHRSRYDVTPQDMMPGRPNAVVRLAPRAERQGRQEISRPKKRWSLFRRA